jgi:LmbE family N-acetylglucosaminyl deacetylase
MTVDAELEAAADPLAPDPTPLEGPEADGGPEQKGPVLASFAHPDDMEISSGGTLARFVSDKREVHLLVLTNGDRGADTADTDRVELARTRLAETHAAAEYLGLASVTVLDNHDGDLENTAAVRADIVRVIRKVKPAVVLTCDPTAWFFGSQYFNHSDHRTAGAVTLDALFPGAGNPLFFSELLEEGLEPWKVPEVWLGWTNEPNHYQDITGFMDRKLQALWKHESQVQGGLIGFFESWLPMEAQENGKKIGAEHAEAFRVLTLG